MKKFTAARFALLATVMASTSIFAAPPTDIKAAMIARCADEAVQLKMTDSASAKKVCSCTFNVQANQLKLGEYWEIQSAVVNRKDPKNIPAMKRIQGDLDKCRAGVKISAPQLPQQSPKK